MPLPPEEAENGENTGNEEPKLQFSYVECLLFSFHQLGKKLPDFLIDKVDAEQLKDFKIRWERLDQCCAAAAFAGTALTLFSHRLQYFARGLQVYIRQLRVALQGKTGDALKTDEVTSQRCCWWLHGWLYFKMFISFVSRTRLKWLLWRSQTISTCSLRWGGVLHTDTHTHLLWDSTVVPVSDPGSLPQSSIIQEHRNIVLETSPKGWSAGVRLSLWFWADRNISFLMVSSFCRAKRPSTDTMDPGATAKKPIPAQPRRDARQIYNPPSGKYSATIGNFNYGEERFMASKATRPATAGHL